LTPRRQTCAVHPQSGPAGALAATRRKCFFARGETGRPGLAPSAGSPASPRYPAGHRDFISMIQVRTSSIHGRGAFAAAATASGETFHTAQLMTFGCEEIDHINATRIGSYVFYIEDCPHGAAHDHVGLAMSPISFVNHRRPCNTTFVVDPAAQTVAFTALT